MAARLAAQPLPEDSHDVCLYIVKRTQIYLEEEQAVRLDERAAAAGTTRSEVIRRAIEAHLSDEAVEEAVRLERFKRAVHQTAGIAPYLPPGGEYVAELRKADQLRVEELDRRRRQ